MTKRKRVKLPPEACISCRSIDVKDGYCRSCGHLSQYATMLHSKSPKRLPAVRMSGGHLWTVPASSAEEREELD